jgi:uncharacterized delta-60 repeat protein
MPGAAGEQLDIRLNVLGHEADEVCHRVELQIPERPAGTVGIANVALENPGAFGDLTLSQQAVRGQWLSNGDALVARFLDTGILDTTFNGIGYFENAATLQGRASAVRVDPDGKIVVAGSGFIGGSFFARFLDNGTLDATFGMAGKVVMSEFIRVSRVEQRAAGGYLASGPAFTCADPKACPIYVVAVTDNGTLDSTFGNGGVAVLQNASHTPASLIGLAELPDGGAIVSGAVDGGLQDHLAVWRLKPNGSLDQSFGSGGLFTLPDRGRAVQAVPDAGGVLVAGIGWDSTTGIDMVMLRFVY